MTDLARNAPMRFRWPNELQTEIWTLDNSAAQTVYQGAPLILDMSEDTLYLRVFDSSVTVATGDVFVGFANEKVTVTTSDTETDNELEVISGTSEVGVKSSVFTDADVGKTVYMSDSGTLTSTSTSNLKIGVLAGVENGYAFVRMSAPTVQ